MQLIFNKNDSTNTSHRNRMSKTINLISRFEEENLKWKTLLTDYSVGASRENIISGPSHSVQ